MASGTKKMDLIFYLLSNNLNVNNTCAKVLDNAAIDSSVQRTCRLLCNKNRLRNLTSGISYCKKVVR